MILDFIQTKNTFFCVELILEMGLFLFRPINRTAKDIALKLLLALSSSVGVNQRISNYQKIIPIDKSDGKGYSTEASSISIICRWF
jgi:hypothetical protein